MGLQAQKTRRARVAVFFKSPLAIFGLGLGLVLAMLLFSLGSNSPESIRADLNRPVRSLFPCHPPSVHKSVVNLNNQTQSNAAFNESPKTCLAIEKLEDSLGCKTYGVVSLDYNGRFGNNLFQYAFARILNLELGFEVQTVQAHAGRSNLYEASRIMHERSVVPESVPARTRTKLSDDFMEDQPNVVVRSNKFGSADMCSLIETCRPASVHIIDAFLHDYQLFKPYKRLLRCHWFNFPRFDASNSETVRRVGAPGADDVVVHVRLGDLETRLDRSFEESGKNEKLFLHIPAPLAYYKQVLSGIQFSRVLLLVEPQSVNHPLVLDLVKEFDAKVLASQDFLLDFWYLLEAKKMVLQTFRL